MASIRHSTVSEGLPRKLDGSDWDASHVFNLTQGKTLIGGPGGIAIEIDPPVGGGGGAWGSITGLITAQTDLQNALSAKASLAAATVDFLGYVTAAQSFGTSGTGQGFFVENTAGFGSFKMGPDRVQFTADNATGTAAIPFDLRGSVISFKNFAGTVMGSFGPTGATVAGNLTVSGSVSAPNLNTFEHNQATASATWTVNHNFGRKPAAVQVLSPGFKEVGAEVVHVNDNQLTVSFEQPQTGYVRTV